MAKTQDGGLVGHAHCTIEAGKATIQGPLVQFFFHGWIALVPPQLQAVDAQHGLDGERGAATQGLVCAAGKRGNEGHQYRPGHDLVHLVEEDFLAGLLGQWVQAQGELIHVRIVLDA